MGVTVMPRESTSWGKGQENWQAPGHNPRNKRQWKTGDIAFLQAQDLFSKEDEEELIMPKPGYRQGYLPPKATGHPVIILRRLSAQSTHVLVTSVSAYSSGDFNDNEAPWKQHRHQHKEKRLFRSFKGCQKYDPQQPYLLLRPGQKMPKPKTSWVYAQSLFVVPLTVIGCFTKSKDDLEMDPDSLAELLAFMEREIRGSQFRDALKRLHDKEPVTSSIPQRFNRVKAESWRNDSDARPATSSGVSNPSPPSTPPPSLPREARAWINAVSCTYRAPHGAPTRSARPSWASPPTPPSSPPRAKPATITKTGSMASGFGVLLAPASGKNSWAKIAA